MGNIDPLDGDSGGALTGDESDQMLVTRVRAGDTAAFDTLFKRHRGLARYVADRHADNYADTGDIVSDAFAAVYESLTAGKGPDTFFRAYLLTTVRRLAFKANRAGSRTQPTEEIRVLDSVEPAQDPSLADFETTAIARAFKALPERWQAVLWYVDIEGMKPAEASVVLGLNPNGVSSLAIRARERLREMYLQQHITASTESDCEQYSSRLGAFARKGLSPRTTQAVQAHLEQCSECTALLVDLDDIQSAMRTALFPLITGFAFISMVPTLAGTVAGGGGRDATPADSVGARSASKPIPLTWNIPADSLIINEDEWDIHLGMTAMKLHQKDVSATRA
jgi:RNA polymerase sigma factor (sigma-70 family)